MLINNIYRCPFFCICMWSDVQSYNGSTNYMSHLRGSHTYSMSFVRSLAACLIVRQTLHALIYFLCMILPPPPPLSPRTSCDSNQNESHFWCPFNSCRYSYSSSTSSSGWHAHVWRLATASAASSGGLRGGRRRSRALQRPLRRRRPPVGSQELHRERFA